MIDLHDVATKLRVTVLLAVAFYVLDSFVVGSLWPALIVLVLARFLRLVIAESAARTEPDPRARIEGLRILIYVAVIALSAGTLHLHNQVAQRRAVAVIGAIERYQRDQGQYPHTLDDLVPAYLPAVPRAKLTLTFNRFSYSDGGDEGGSLRWTRLPPYGLARYSFKERRWTLGRP